MALRAPRFSQHPVYELNETGAYLWEGLARGDGRDKIAADYAAEFGVSAECARGDLAGFESSMRGIGAIPR